MVRPVFVVVLATLLVGPLAGCFSAPSGTSEETSDEIETPRFGPFPPVDLADVNISDVTVESFDGTGLAVTIFQPPHATAESPVPVILHGNYWSGQRWQGLGPDPRVPLLGGPGPDHFLEAGFAVASMEQRGHGDSEGVDQVFLPEVHARDVLAVVDHLASIAWIALDGPNDPVVGTVGVSYGAIFQVLTTLYETQEAGATRIDAIAPFSFDFDFDQSLNPNGVPRSVWWDLLVALAYRYDIRTSTEFNAQYAYLVSTGSPMELDAPNPRSVRTFVDQGVHLDVPALVMNGAHDTRFDPGEVLRFYENALTPAAKSQSVVAIQRYGHTIPEVQTPPSTEPCKDVWQGDVWAFAVDWHVHHLLGARMDLGPAFQIATETECLMLDELPPPKWHAVSGNVLVQAPASLQTPPPEPALLAIASGPATLVGVPLLNATAAVALPGARVFFALAAGSSTDEVRILGDQWMPLELDDAGQIEDLHLAGISSTVTADETLYLAVARWVDQFAHHHDRVPGPVRLESFEVGLPIVAAEQGGPADPSAPAALRGG